MRSCFLATCGEPATIEAIGVYDRAFGIEETVAIVLCARHASLLRDDVVLLDAPPRSAGQPSRQRDR